MRAAKAADARESAAALPQVPQSTRTSPSPVTRTCSVPTGVPMRAALRGMRPSLVSRARPVPTIRA